MSTLGSIELLIAALRADASPTEWQPRAQTADAEKLAVSAIVLGIAPLLHDQLSRWNVSLSPRADAKLLAASRASLVRQQAIELQLAEILDACARERIVPIVLKGAYLAAFVYPDSGLRPMNDIDVLVRAEQLAAVESVLVRLGYVGSYKDPASGARVIKHTSSFRKARADASTPNPYLSTDSERTVEPHISLEESWFGLRADITPGIWERSVPIDFRGHVARALCPSDLMLHLCIHLTFHLIMGWPSIVQLIDLLMVGRRLSPDEWHEIVQRAQGQRVSRYIYAALRLAKIALDAPIPDGVLRDLANATPSHVRAHAETLSIADMMQRTQKPPLTTLAQRLKRGVQDRAETARWAGTFGERLAVWRTLVDVARTDTGQMLGEKIKRTVGSGQ
jgi:putative nucleotidyltransferase-like protein